MIHRTFASNNLKKKRNRLLLVLFRRIIKFQIFQDWPVFPISRYQMFLVKQKKHTFSWRIPHNAFQELPEKPKPKQKEFHFSSNHHHRKKISHFYHAYGAVPGFDNEQRPWLNGPHGGGVDGMLPVSHTTASFRELFFLFFLCAHFRRVAITRCSMLQPNKCPPSN